MKTEKSSLVCMSDSLYRLGLAGVLEELGYKVCLVEKPSDINLEVSRGTDCLIIGEHRNISIIATVVSCVEKTEPAVIVVIVRTLKLSEVEQLKSLRVNAILSTDMRPEGLARALVLLPEHWIVNTGIAVPDGIASTHLTDREWQVIEMISVGNSVKEIAQVLKLSVKTIEAHKSNLMKKLGIHNKARLAIWWVENKHLWRARSED